MRTQISHTYKHLPFQGHRSLALGEVVAASTPRPPLQQWRVRERGGAPLSSRAGAGHGARRWSRCAFYPLQQRGHFTPYPAPPSGHLSSLQALLSMLFLPRSRPSAPLSLLLYMLSLSLSLPPCESH
ncbi:hypothetical protein E2C01_100880 [Portunus trituberculatus]|uniref:Uncharacterized protein n=1 Tax=Portunus trituberculatus TaxID=210409 RepID=A0A5B7KJ15_PORTR|nr:hypothetical protein [Portunus trituberculatus]